MQHRAWGMEQKSSASSENQVQNSQYNYCSQCACKDGTNPSVAKTYPKFPKDPVTQDTSDNTNNDVADETKAAAFEDHTAQPAGCSSDDKNNNNFHFPDVLNN
jgi:hypothetical protein